MYIPEIYRAQAELPEIQAFIQAHSFGCLIAPVEGRPWATHIPFAVEPAEAADAPWFLSGHLAKANPQSRAIAEGQEVLAVFQGPHAYISPSWYTAPNVPTWNYEAMHIYGLWQSLSGEALWQRLEVMVKHYEDLKAEKPQYLEQVPESVLRADFRGIIGFRLEVKEIQLVRKFSQNRDAQSHAQICQALRQSPQAEAQALAKLMAAHKPEGD